MVVKFGNFFFGLVSCLQIPPVHSLNVPTWLFNWRLVASQKKQHCDDGNDEGPKSDGREQTLLVIDLIPIKLFEVYLLKFWKRYVLFANL
jgi:hypothetical protein